MTTEILEEGQTCPYCKEGQMEYPEVENCSCHINAPCANHTNIELECSECGFSEDEFYNTEWNKQTTKDVGETNDTI